MAVQSGQDGVPMELLLGPALASTGTVWEADRGRTVA